MKETASQCDGRDSRGCGTGLGLAHGALRCHKIYGTPPRCASVWYLVDYLALTAADELCSHCLPGFPMPLCCAEGSKHCSAAVLQKSVSSAQEPKLRCGQYIIVGMRKLYAEVQAGFTTINFARRWTQRRGEGGRGRGVSPSVNIRH